MYFLHVLNKRPTLCFLSLTCPRNPILVKTQLVPSPVLRLPRLCLSLCQFSLPLAKRRLRKSWTCWLPGYLGNQVLMSLRPCKSTWALLWGCFSLACVRRNSGTVYQNIPAFPLCDLGERFYPDTHSYINITSEHYVLAKLSEMGTLIIYPPLWVNLSF